MFRRFISMLAVVLAITAPARAFAAEAVRLGAVVVSVWYSKRASRPRRTA